jgi:hypothetical protein
MGAFRDRCRSLKGVMQIRAGGLSGGEDYACKTGCDESPGVKVTGIMRNIFLFRRASLCNPRWTYRIQSSVRR